MHLDWEGDNMKILVFSDSHRSVSPMVQAIEGEKPEQVIHLGDLMEDAEELTYWFPQLPVCMVPGNCDGWTTVPLIKRITLQGKSILLSHGHLWGVKSGYDTALYEGRKAGADVLLFGHTHRPLCERTEDGLWVMNPGTSRSSYGTIQIRDGEVSCALGHV